jgi:hypothetical protein
LFHSKARGGVLVRTHIFTDDELGSFRDFQRISYEILEIEADQLEPGVSEVQVTRQLRRLLICTEFLAKNGDFLR